MKIKFSKYDFDNFSLFIRNKYGVVIDENKSYIFSTKLDDLIDDYKIRDAGDFLYKLKNDEIFESKVICRVTVNETMWFRDAYPWEFLSNELMDIYVNQLRSGNKEYINIWSAASSTGQEAYSTVICIKNYLDKNEIKDIGLERFKVHATDISNDVLSFAKEGIYTEKSLERGIEDNDRERYFYKLGNKWKLSEEIMECVNFEQFNLLEEYNFENSFDIIFCRNILIYFTKEVRNQILSKMVDVLNDESIIFFGAAEILIYDADKFGLDRIRYNNNLYYRKKYSIKGVM